jgi:hypothetical protein
LTYQEFSQENIEGFHDKTQDFKKNPENFE